MLENQEIRKNKTNPAPSPEQVLLFGGCMMPGEQAAGYG